jgi:hypothetical protein
MNELPSEAKRLLDLAKDAQRSVDPALRSRVRLRVDAALAGTLPLGSERAGAGFGGRAPAAGRHLVSPKFVVLSGVLLIGAGAILWASRREVSRADESARIELPAHAQRASSTPVPVGEVLTDAGAMVSINAEQKVQPAVDRAPQANAFKAAPGLHGTLAAETTLLENASRALFAGDIEGARATLRVYRHRFRRPQLLLERDGLSVLADCMERSDNAQRDATAYIRQHPASVLVRRIQRVCGLGDGQ